MSRRITVVVREPSELLQEMKTTVSQLFEGESDLAYSEIFNYIETRIAEHTHRYGEQKHLKELIRVLEVGTALEFLELLCGEHALNEIHLLIEEQAIARYITNEVSTEA